MKGPADLAGARIVCADMSGRRGQRLAHHAPENEQILVNHTRRSGADRDFLGIAPEPFTQIHSAGFTEARDKLACPRIQRIKKMARRNIDAALPIGKAAIAEFPHDLSAFTRIEAPEQLSAGGVERNHSKPGSGGVERAVHDNGIALHFRPGKRVAGIECPGDLQAAHIVAIDLFELGIADVFRPAAVNAPIPVVRLGRREHQRGGCRQDDDRFHSTRFRIAVWRTLVRAASRLASTPTF